MMNLLRNERGELGLLALIGALFGSVLIVGATVMNSTSNSSSNLSETVSEFQMSEPFLEPTTDYNLEVAVPIAKSDDKPVESREELKDIIELKEEKFNEETKEYLKTLENTQESREYIIKFKNSVDSGKLTKFDLKENIGKFKLAKIEGKAEDLQNLIEDDEIEFIELDQEVKPLGDFAPYNVQKTKADTVWNLSNGSGVKIAVLDTGIASHNDLNIAGGVFFVSEDYSDSNGHGTAVVGVISAVLNNEGLAGVAPDASLYSVKIIDGSTGSLSDAILGIEWAIDNNMDIVTMSFGVESYSEILKEVLDEAYDDGVLLITASGNEGSDNILYPAAYESVIAVGATDSNDNLASFSSYGFKQELVAPGVDINSTSLSNGYSVSSGTSLAAPHVAGVAALIKSYNNSLTNVEIRNKLRNDALDLGLIGKDDYFGYGLVHVNLLNNNFTSFNDSYFYEIFNISDYGLENVTYNFWISGTGTIDDLNFSIGFYRINLTYQNGNNNSFVLNVSEEGQIILFDSLVLTPFDDFTKEGNSDDSIVWKNGYFAVRLAGNQQNIIDGECFEDGPFSNRWDSCFFPSNTLRKKCDAGVTTIDCSVTSCNSSALMQDFHKFLDTSSSRSNIVGTEYYHFCNQSTQQGIPLNSINYYIIDKKRARCINSSNYVIEGHYGSGSWISVGEIKECIFSNCFNDYVNYTNPQDNVTPCVTPNTCNGEVQVITAESNGKLLSSLLVTKDSTNKVTDIAGTANFNFSNDCGEYIDFVVKCQDNTTVCDTKSTSLDFNGDYDSLIFDCTKCTNNQDLIVRLGGVNISTDTNTVRVNFTVENVGTVSNVNVTIKAQDKTTGLIFSENYSLVNINSGDKSKATTIKLNLNNADFVHVYIDAGKVPKVNESKNNNYVAVPVITRKVKAYVSVDTGLSEVDDVIKDYIHLFVIPTAQSAADLKIAVSLLNKSAFIKSEGPSSRYSEWYVDGNSIYFNGDPLENYPHTGIVATEYCEQCAPDTVFAVGTGIEGVVASVKRLVSARSLFLTRLTSTKESSIIEKTDILGLSVYDLMHNSENSNDYMKNTPEFANVVTKILTDNNYEVAIKTVRTYNDNTTLRLKNVNSDFSQNFKSAIVTNQTPIVFAGGIFSNLFAWEMDNGLPIQLAREGRDTWEIEITGGPATDDNCLPSGIYNCPNYDYEDLVDYYWPALIAGVETYSDQDKIVYVGHSNGCRVALDSLKNYSSTGKNNAGYYFDTNSGTYLLADLASNPVDIFFGLGCPGVLNGSSEVIDRGLENGNAAIQFFENKNQFHLNGREFAKHLKTTGPSFIWPQNYMSLNLANYYLSIVESNEDFYPGSGLTLNKLYLFAGEDSPFEFGNEDGDDGLVPVSDMVGINSTVSYAEGELKIFPEGHHSLVDDKTIHNYIIRKLGGG